MNTLADRIASGELTRRKDATYRYHDRVGNVVVKKVKYGFYDANGVRVDKDFRIFNRFDPANRPCAWEPSIGKYWDSIYRLPQLWKFRAQGRGWDIHLTEGEEDANTGAAHGLVTTTTYSLMMPCHAEWLRGFLGTVHIVADRDLAGSLIAARRAALLGAVGVKTRILLPAVLEPKSDLTDHFTAGYGVSDLVVADLRQIEAEAAAAQEVLDNGGRVFGSAEYLEGAELWRTSPFNPENGTAAQLRAAGVAPEEAVRLAEMLRGMS